MPHEAHDDLRPGDATPHDRATAAPGWYPTDDGGQRWWDGHAWTKHVVPPPPAAPPPPRVPSAPTSAATGVVSADERGMATLAHVTGIFASFLGPLVIYLLKKDDAPFVRHHAAEALNFSISVAVYSIVLGIVGAILLLVVVGVVFLLALPVIGVVAVVLHIVAAVAANRGEHYRYPLTIRLVS